MADLTSLFHSRRLRHHARAFFCVLPAMMAMPRPALSQTAFAPVAYAVPKPQPRPSPRDVLEHLLLRSVEQSARDSVVSEKQRNAGAWILIGAAVGGIAGAAQGAYLGTKADANTRILAVPILMAIRGGSGAIVGGAAGYVAWRVKEVVLPRH